MSDETELKPCPFCGGKAEATNFGDGVYASCADQNCEYSTALTPEAWNTRPLEDALRDRVSELELRLDVGTGNMYDVVVEENKRLRSRLASYEEDYRRIVAGECAPDEQHCTCVPALRAEIARLTAELDRVKKLHAELWVASARLMELLYGRNII